MSNVTSPEPLQDMPRSDTATVEQPAGDQADPTSPITCLGPQDRGRWLVTTRGSQHLWDLDAGTYQRIPGEGRAAFAHDEAIVRITRVERWPAVGSSSLLWFDDPDHPWALEHWRQSSTIVSIEPLPGDAVPYQA